MNRSKEASRGNWIALFAGMFLILGLLLSLVYVYIIAPEMARGAEFRRQQRIAEVIERHGGSVEWIGIDYGYGFDFLSFGTPHSELLPTAIFSNPEVDLFSASKPKQPEKKTPRDQARRSAFKRSTELFTALRELDPDTIYFNRTDFDSDDFARLKGLHITTFIASETLLDDRAADSLNCLGPYLQSGEFDYSAVGDKFIEKLCKSTHVVSLNLEGTNITGTCAAFLATRENLSHLNLSHTDFDDAGLAHLENCQSLRHLNINYTKVTARGLADFKPPPTLARIEVAGLEFPQDASQWVLDKQIKVIGREKQASNPKSDSQK